MAEALHRLLERNARKYPAKLAVRYPAGNLAWTWQDLNARANAAAAALVQAGIRPGDRVALLIPNRPGFVQAYFGILKAGGVVVPINVRLTAGEASYILQDSGARALIADPTLRETAERAAAGTGVERILGSDELDAPGLAADPDRPSSLDALAEILYTSGTTGRPKGVELTHNAVHSVASMMAYEIDIRQDDKVLILMPLTHSAPLNLTLLGAVYCGAASVLGDFTPGALVDFSETEKTTHFFGAPVAYLLGAKLLADSPRDLSSAKCWVYGGAPMSREAVQGVRRAFPGKLVSVYGLTESGPNGVALHDEEHEAHAGSIGRAGVVNVEMRVVTPEGRDVPPGEAGEIIMRTPSALVGYHGNPQATREALRDGWVWTGDIARIDEEGYLWIMDRKKDVIISGGVNVYPKEVEDVLSTHPGVADVAVIGVPHPEWGETVAAVLVARGGQPTEAELQSFVRERLADFKVPRLFRFVAAIPRNASGKILKHSLRESVS